MLDNFQVFDNDLSLVALQTYQDCGVLAVDTETMGLVPRRDRLCLVQVGDEQGRVSLIRLAQGMTAAPHLQTLLEAADLVKIFHYARFDVGMLRYHLGIETRAVFCTKIASKLARTYSPRHGLKEVVQELVGVELDKTAQSSDWGAVGELSESQLRYAGNDVRYLIPAYLKLKQMLHREGRLALAERCFNHLSTLVELDLLGYDDVFSH
ncbi:ribonuclease H-like domain-containing protein [Candidatus Cyanaurora vandensis]|uniref:ribonuclease H-like domain-containing protein n=1 Tax=Candidatus Cyanaurora vandensis TaxID=2714958 RepID=UPI00257F2FCD|nr:ribonuclease H-like domain-containing protein [Candidatus Cyanaurora vandensis]